MHWNCYPQNGFPNFIRVDLSNVYYVGSYTDRFSDNCYGPCRPCRGYVNFLPYDYQMNPFRFIGGPRVGALCWDQIKMMKVLCQSNLEKETISMKIWWLVNKAYQISYGDDIQRWEVSCWLAATLMMLRSITQQTLGIVFSNL
jgi:hypothetical protein